MYPTVLFFYVPFSVPLRRNVLHRKDGPAIKTLLKSDFMRFFNDKSENELCLVHPNISHVIVKDIPWDFLHSRDDTEHVLHDEIIVKFSTMEGGIFSFSRDFANKKNTQKNE